MLKDYIQAAMRRAKYELLPGSEGFYAEIPGLSGVWANAATLEACREELEEVLQEWLLLTLRQNGQLPVLDGLDLNTKVA